MCDFSVDHCEGPFQNHCTSQRNKWKQKSRVMCRMLFWKTENSDLQLRWIQICWGSVFVHFVQFSFKSVIPKSAVPKMSLSYDRSNFNFWEKKKNTTTTNREKIIFKSNETMLIRNKEECWSFIIQVWKIALKCSTSHTSYMQLSKISIGLFIFGERGKINSYISKKPMREDLQLWKLPSYLSFFWVLKLLSVY